MDRRHFSKTIITALGASALPAGVLRAHGVGLGKVQDPPSVNGDRIRGWLADFSRFGRRADGGVDRVAFSDADIEGRAWVRALCRA